MKGMKKYLIILLAGLLTTSCMNDYEADNISTDKFTADSIGEANTTITALRKKYSSIISNSSYTCINEDLIVEGIVTGNDITGNLYQVIVIQPTKEDGTVDTSVPGINVGIKGISCIYNIFPVGQVIRINLKGLFIGGYGKCAKIGQPYITASTTPTERIGPMSYPDMQARIMKVGTANANNVVAKELTSADVASGNIADYTPMLVTIKNCKIKEADGITTYAHAETSTTYSVENTLLFSDKKTSVELYTSSSATFASNVMPEGWLNVTGILSRYNDYWQLQLRSESDIEKVQ